ncbi:MAG: NADH-quinone oxidoreductase subunit C [Anaerolineaceae bacterium]|nr:NADH-quinone oxidoreductase subunit C [Anaerolineaceae bacterium]
MTTEKAVNKLLDALNLDRSSTKAIPMYETEITISKQQMFLAVKTILKSGIWHLSAITCQQLEDDFILLYHFWKSGGITLRISLDENNPQIDSICLLVPGAEYYERETREMFGIEFLGLPNPIPLLLPDNWQGGYPMRKKEQTSRDKLKDNNCQQKGRSS